MARSNVGVHFGDGAGGIAYSTFLEGYSFTGGSAVADLDGDGSLDIVVGDSNPEGVDLGFAFGDGLGQFEQQTIHVGTSGPNNPIVVGDYDEDGNVDLAVGTRIWIGDGVGGFESIGDVDSNVPGRVAADLDDDGHLDLLTLGSGDLSYLPGDGRGRFRTTRVASSFADDLATADFDGDGFTDIAGSLLTGAQIFLSDGVGGVRPRQTIETGGIVVAVAAGDFDGNGVPDLALANKQSRDVAILFGDGQGGFGEPSSFGVSPKPVDIAAGDFNQDGFDDLVVATSLIPTHNAIDIYLGDGNGAFASVYTHSESPSLPLSVHVADIDGDQNLDVIATYTGDLFLNSRPHMLALRGDGLGGFSPPAQRLGFQRNTRARDGLVGDMNEDGLADLVMTFHSISSPYFQWISIITSDGDGTFTDRQFPVGRFADVTILDADGDGHLDVAGQGGGQIFIFRGDGNGGLDTANPTKFYAPDHGNDLVTLDFENDGSDDMALASGRLSPIPNLTFAQFGCRTSDVNRGAGAPVDVLLVDGSAGSGEERVVSVPIGTPFQLQMNAPPATSPAAFTLYATVGSPTRASLDRQPRHLGLTCMPTPLTGRLPQPTRIWNNTGRNIAGVPTDPSSPAPSLVFQGASPVGVTVFLQGFIQDAGAPNGAAARTNGIELRIE